MNLNDDDLRYLPIDRNIWNINIFFGLVFVQPTPMLLLLLLTVEKKKYEMISHKCDLVKKKEEGNRKERKERRKDL